MLIQFVIQMLKPSCTPLAILEICMPGFLHLCIRIHSHLRTHKHISISIRIRILLCLHLHHQPRCGCLDPTMTSPSILTGTTPLYTITSRVWAISNPCSAQNMLQCTKPDNHESRWS